MAECGSVALAVRLQCHQSHLGDQPEAKTVEESVGVPYRNLWK